MAKGFGLKLLASCLLLALAGSLLAGCGEEPVRLTLTVLGDVDNPLTIRGLQDVPETVKLKHKDKTVAAAPLAPVIEQAQPYGQRLEILFIAADGFSALIDNDNLEQCYLALSRENGWEAINLHHPVSSNIKNIVEIVIIAQDLPVDQAFTIIQPGKDIARLSAGALYKQGYSISASLRGSSAVEHEGKELTATTFYRHRTVDLEDYVSLEGRTAAVVGADGRVEPLRQDGRFILDKNCLGYMAGDELVIPRAKGLVLDPPAKRITDVYADSLQALEEGVPILVILLDGFGLHQYQYASSRGYTPFLDTLPEPAVSMSAYPSITPVNVASSLSGELPHVTGVHDRRTRRQEVPTIFAQAGAGKVMTAVIGPLNTVELEVEPVFNVDRNNDGSTDDEKTQYALSVIGQSHDLLFVHYKDIDATGHDWGDLHQNTLDAIGQADEYVRQLVENWRGRVLIYADHGMYETKTGGAHGNLVAKSMFTPYWLFDTGN